MFQYVIGVDEVGRGPLAGPVAVGVVCVARDFAWEQLAGVTDSKKLSPEKRVALFRQAWHLRRSGVLDWSVGMSAAQFIDERGIVPAINVAMHRAFAQVEKRISAIYRTNAPLSDRAVVKLDGGLRAPARFVAQETICKGDSREKVIGLASILAKVTRDRYMARIGAQPQFAPYDFATHKGYGTKAHRQAIQTHGLSLEHRQSYCKNLAL